MIIVGIVLFMEERRDKKAHIVIYFLLSFIISALLVTFVFKNIFQRPRPVPNKQYSSIACPKDYSFPSGHAATAFAAATVLAVIDRKRGKFYFLVAFLISLSRIYLQCHYLLDVMGGGVIGFLIGRGVLLFRKKPASTTPLLE
jgi:undecaprenyl-diphosphatase